MRLLATDLDGTLLGPGGSLSDRNIDALRAAHVAGWYVVIASGRPPFMVSELVERIGPGVTHGVLANGSIVCTFPDQRTLRAVKFDASVAVDTVRTLRVHAELGDGFGFALATDAGFAHEPGFAERMPAPQEIPPAPDALAAADGAAEAIKLMVFHRRMNAHTLLEVLPSVLGDGLSVTHMGADCVEVGPAGIDKGTGLRFLCDHLGVDLADVVVFGDEFNDHEMLAIAGHAVVMDNANDVTKTLAHEIAPPNSADGVAVVLERLLADGRP
jgi:Cof subfamily protein (haloacid dehalogenase superfamily)